MAIEAKRNQKEDAGDSSWAVPAAEEDLRGRGGSGGTGVLNSEDNGRIHWLNQQKGPRSVRVSCAPCPIKALARPPRAPWEEAPAGSPKSGKHINERAMVRCRGAREKGAMAFVECLGASQEDTMESPL